MFSYSQKIMGLSMEAERAVGELTKGRSGNIRISTPGGLGPSFFSSFLPEVSKKLPEVQFHSDVSNEVRDLATHQIDFALRATKDHHQDTIARYLGHVRDVICVTPQLMKKLNLGEDPKSLSKAGSILYENGTSWNRWTLILGKQEVQVEVQGKHVTNTYQAAMALCLKGLGIARFPYYVAAEEILRGNLVQLFPKYQITTHPLYLAYLKNEYPSHKHKIVKAEIINWFKGRPEYFV